MLSDFRQDLRYATRTLRKRPGFAAIAIVTLALGIGATTAIFTVVNAVLINPLPYPDSGALVRIVHAIGGVDQPYFNDAIYTTYADHSQALQDVGVWSPGETAAVTGRGEPEQVSTLTASRSVLTTLGVQPAIGRWFSAGEDAPGAADVVMLGHGYWQRAFGGDRTVLGRSLVVNARPHQIVGVMPDGFRFDGEPELILPLRIDRGNLIPAFRLVGVARMKPGVTLAQANADATRVLHVWFETAGTRPAVRARWAPAFRPLKQDVVGDVGQTLWVLMAAIGVVLLMACANVASLQLTQAAARREELATRAVLGARWTRLARQLLVENLMLAVLGGALGIGVAYGGLRVLTALGPSNLPRLDEIAIDPTVLGFAVSISVVSALLFGLLPILKSARPTLTDALVGRGAGPAHERQRSQRALVAAQVAMALVLLVSAGLMVQSFRALHGVEPGFTDPRRVQTFTISISNAIAAEPERVTRLQQQVLDTVAAVPGVVSAAFTTRLPMGSDRASSALAIEGRASDDRTPPNRQVKIISPGMFRTLGTPLVAGRDFTWTDLYDLRPVAIISDNLARELWASPAAALGQRVREHYDPRSPWREIVGVAADVHDDGADQPPPATIYWPAQPLDALQGGYQARRVSVAVRIEDSGAAGVLGGLRDAVRSVHPDVPLAQARTLDEVYAQSMARTSFTLVMLAIGGGMAVLLGLSGVYGVVAYAVAQRRREIGIRMALGAPAREIRRMFVRRGAGPVAAGVAIGLGAAVGLTRVMASVLFGTSPLDPLTFTAMPALLAVAAVLASYLPARRAAAVDPAEVLRAD